VCLTSEKISLRYSFGV